MEAGRHAWALSCSAFHCSSVLIVHCSLSVSYSQAEAVAHVEAGHNAVGHIRKELDLNEPGVAVKVRWALGTAFASLGAQ